MKNPYLDSRTLTLSSINTKMPIPRQLGKKTPQPHNFSKIYFNIILSYNIRIKYGCILGDYPSNVYPIRETYPAQSNLYFTILTVIRNPFISTSFSSIGHNLLFHSSPDPVS